MNIDIDLLPINVLPFTIQLVHIGLKTLNIIYLRPICLHILPTTSLDLKSLNKLGRRFSIFISSLYIINEKKHTFAKKFQHIFYGYFKKIHVLLRPVLLVPRRPEAFSFTYNDQPYTTLHMHAFSLNFCKKIRT